MRARLILYTKATGHPLPVARYARGRSVQRSDRAPEGGRAGTGGTSGPALSEGETRERRRTVRHRLTGVLLVTRDKGGARCSPCDVDAGVRGGQGSSWVPASTKAENAAWGGEQSKHSPHNDRSSEICRKNCCGNHINEGDKRWYTSISVRNIFLIKNGIFFVKYKE